MPQLNISFFLNLVLFSLLSFSALHLTITPLFLSRILTLLRKKKRLYVNTYRKRQILVQKVKHLRHKMKKSDDQLSVFTRFLQLEYEKRQREYGILLIGKLSSYLREVYKYYQKRNNKATSSFSNKITKQRKSLAYIMNSYNSNNANTISRTGS